MTDESAGGCIGALFALGLAAIVLYFLVVCVLLPAAGFIAMAGVVYGAVKAIGNYGAAFIEHVIDSE